MAKVTNRPSTNQPGASFPQLLAFTLLGACTATLLSWITSTSANPAQASVPIHKSWSNSTPVDANIIDMSKVKILSFDPFIAHITDFVSASERKHLLELGTPLLEESVIIDDSGNEVPSPGRTSRTAFLPEADPIVASIAQRAAAFQGHLSPADIDVQITAYTPGQEYKHHYDWYPSPRPKNRVSTFFAILQSTCSDCGTEFPFLDMLARAEFDGRWCEVMDCSKEMLTTRNVEGSALFWVNLDKFGEGRLDVLHAGLPAVGGEKVGLNVWTDIDLHEAKSRGLLKTQGKQWYRPSQEFLRKFGLVKPEED